MANLPESSTFDSGVYQIETTDPVIGGPSGVTNTPLKNLANRTKYLKDHVDALESSRAPLASPALTGTPTAPTAAQGTSTTQIATTAFVNAEIAADMAANLATVAPAMNGAAAVGVSAKMAREDHIHPADTSRAPLASPAFTGTPTAPTAAQGTNTTQLATTAFVNTAVADGGTPLDSTAVNIKMNGTQSAGTATTAARADHVHPTDTSRAPIASPAFTGTPTAPTPIAGTRSTRLATMQMFSDEFVSSLTGNGYQKLPSGLIMQWGYVASIGPGAQITINYPTAFPNQIFGVTAQYALPSPNNAISALQINSAGQTSFVAQNADPDSSAPFFWIALGR